MGISLSIKPPPVRLRNGPGLWVVRPSFCTSTTHKIDMEGFVIDERFTLSEDGTELHWEGRITDPVNFTDPVVQRILWTWVPGHEIKPFNCAVAE